MNGLYEALGLALAGFIFGWLTMHAGWRYHPFGSLVVGILMLYISALDPSVWCLDAAGAGWFLRPIVFGAGLAHVIVGLSILYVEPYRLPKLFRGSRRQASLRPRLRLTALSRKPRSSRSTRN